MDEGITKVTVTDYIKMIVPMCKTDQHEYLDELLDKTGKNALRDVTLEEAAEYYELLTHRLLP